MILETEKVDALRVVLEDYSRRAYKLGETDCATLCADYADLLDVPHGWDRDSVRGLAAPYKTLVRCLGRSSALDPVEMHGDICLLLSVGDPEPILSLRTGRGFVTMSKQGLTIYPTNARDVRAAWRF